jgi:hypothetical protein
VGYERGEVVTLMVAPRVAPWTPVQVARLGALIDAGASAVRSSAAMKRSIISVQTKARQIGKPFPSVRAVKRARLAKEAAAIQRE